MKYIYEIIFLLYENWSFTKLMAFRELKTSTSGSVVGLAWLLIRPFIQVGAYVFLVSFIFQVGSNKSTSIFDNTLYVLSGMFVWQIIQKSLEDSTSLIRNRIDIVKQVPYPIETLPVTAFITSLLPSIILLLTYLCLATVSDKLHISLLLLPIPYLLLLLLCLGLSWLFMVIGIIFKDLREIVSVILALMVYVTPVILREDMVSLKMWNVILLNPFSHIVIAFRDIFSNTFHQISWIIFATMSFVFFIIGAIAIKRAKVTINEYI